MLFHVIPIKPSHRGFFCDDKSLQKPFQKETIPTWLTIIVGFFVTIPVVRELKFIYLDLRSIGFLFAYWRGFT